MGLAALSARLVALTTTLSFPGARLMPLQFGEFELDRERRQLLRSGQPVPLEPKAYELLVLLVERRPRALSRAQIRDVVWPGVFVSESTLGVAVNAIRQALGDDARQPRFIRTVHGFGYAFCGETAGEEEARLTGARPTEPRGPYPGLSSFTEEDAEIFFGREVEVEALWERIHRRRLLAVIGPSGAGKTSFVRAGLIPGRPEGWGAIVSTPGRAPMTGLAQALAPEIAGDAEAVKKLLRFDDPVVALAMLHRWRQGFGEALLVVDQAEELFTLNPPETQARFAELLGRLSKDVDLHVLLSLRDDFLIRCSEHEALAPVFTADLTPLLALEGEGLRQALVEPAKKEGFAFEDDSLVEEMLDSVEGARGALPLLAFAVSRLWERRDKETKLLTRAAYEEIGGVAGALAQHAEQTLERIGLERESIVRELFRNLVTAQWTRAAAERDELLSVLPDREVGGQVLDALIDARLLTSYEAHEGTDESAEATPARHRIEIVHESLLRAWPRLVRWQAQDEEGALLRDQLKQAAHLWEEKGRPDDLLWTGTSEREFELWRDRYPGALTAVEGDFAEAMIHRAQRRKRVRRTVAASTIAVLLAVLTTIGSLWRRSVAEAQRAEASKLLALGRLDLETHPTAALAYARKSLEVADTPEARRFALEVLWRGPVARILPATQAAKELDLTGPGIVGQIVPSPDGRWLATWSTRSQILLFPRDGGPTRVLPRTPDGNTSVVQFGLRGDLLITGGSGESLRFWSLPDLREIRNVELGGVESEGVVRGGRLLTLTRMSREDHHRVIRAWPLPEGEPAVLGTLDDSPWAVDATGTLLGVCRGRSVRLRPLDASRPASERVLGSAEDEVWDLKFSPTGDRLASIDRSGEIRLWSLAAGARAPLRILEGPKGTAPGSPFLFNGDGSALATGTADGALHVWDLAGPPDAQPAILRRPDEINLFPVAFDPRGQWLAASDGRAVAFWPLSSPRMRELHGGRMNGYWLTFTADGRWLVSCGVDDATRVWPLSPADGSARVLTEPCLSIARHPVSPHVLVGTDKVLLVPIEGGPPRQLLDRWEGAAVFPVAFDVQGRRAVAGPLNHYGSLRDPEQRVLRIWDLASGEERVISVARITDASWVGFYYVAFAPDGSLFASGDGGVRRLVLPDEPGGPVSSETVYAQTWAGFDLSRDGRYLLVWAIREGDFADAGCDELLFFDLQKQTSRRITTHGERVRSATLDASGRIIVTADVNGVVRVGPATGEEPHLLLGQTGPALAVSVSPDRRWISSWSSEVVHLWPMPDVTKPPFHTLPYEELMAKLRALTNLEVVEDQASATGYRVEVGPFPGWEEVPTW